MIGVFMSHSSADGSFARRLGNDLRGHGAQVWIDEAEIKVGESLIDKISDGIENTDYLAVILSRHSCRSEWVRREVNIALTHEIRGRRLKVLPCLLEDCDMPPFLIDRKYADFRSPTSYRAGRADLLKALGLIEHGPEERLLDQLIFYDLGDLNDGFDVASIRYFSAEDFSIALERIEVLGFGVFGIERWSDGKFGHVRTFEEYGSDPLDPMWYKSAFQELRQFSSKSLFAASYYVPATLLEKFVRQARHDA